MEPNEKMRVPQSRKRKKVIYISVAVVAIVLIGLIALILILNSKKTVTKAPNDSSTASPSTTAVTTAPNTTATIETTTAAQTQKEAQTEVTTETGAQTEAPTEAPTEPQTEPTIPDFEEPTYINGVLIVNKTYPLPASYNPGGILPEVLNAFIDMAADAAEQGITLKILSGFRSYEYQQKLYENYAAKDGYEAADKYSARPGHSEHQTGLGMDINSLNQSFAYSAEGIWLAANCYKYGFIIRYPEGKEAQTGYMYEPWHIRYLGVDLATAVTNSGLCLEEYLGITSQYQN